MFGTQKGQGSDLTWQRAKKAFSPLIARIVRPGRIFQQNLQEAIVRKQQSLLEADGGRCDSYTLSSNSCQYSPLFDCEWRVSGSIK